MAGFAFLDLKQDLEVPKTQVESGKASSTFPLEHLDIWSGIQSKTSPLLSVVLFVVVFSSPCLSTWGLLVDQKEQSGDPGIILVYWEVGYRRKEPCSGWLLWTWTLTSTVFQGELEEEETGAA